MRRRSTHLRDGQDKILTELRTASAAREDLPEVRESELIRKLLDLGIEDVAQSSTEEFAEWLGSERPDPEEIPLSDLMDESALAKWRHNRFKDMDGWLVNQRSGFRTQVASHFKKRFKNGYDEEELAEFSENMRKKAHYLWPGEEYEEDREDALSYVSAVLRSAQASVRVSDRDPLDPETLFASFEGVEESRDRDVREQVRSSGLMDSMISEVEDRIERLRDNPGAQVSEDALAAALSSEFGVSRDIASEAVRDVTRPEGDA